MINWHTTQTDIHTVHTAQCDATDETQIRKTFEACVNKAISLLTKNIQDDSLYLLFEWNQHTSTLNILVTDATKTQDSHDVIQCIYSGINEILMDSSAEEKQVYSETIHFWLHDYLTTCTAFFRYSLVAIFHSSDRTHTLLL